MCKIKIKYLVGIICVLIILLSCFLCLYDLVLKEKSKATTENVTTGLESNIFNTDGTINANAAKALLDLVGYFDYSATETAYTAHNIVGRTSDNSGKGIIFKMGYANGTSGEDLVWQATYLYNNYLTIWLDKNYNTNTWDSDYGVVNYNTYPNSDPQVYFDGTLYNLITQSSSTLKSIFATPRQAGYQTIKSGTTNDTSYKYSSSYTSTFDNMAEGAADSYLWLPSFYEVCNTSTSSTYTNSTTAYTGQWCLNSTDRAFATSCYTGSGTASYCWLRSGRSDDYFALQVYSSGGSYTGDVAEPYGVRPAAHLSLSSIYSLTKYLIIFNSNGGSSCASIKVESVSNATYGTLPTPTRTGYTFAGWYKNSDFSGSPVTANDIITADHTLYAKWVKGNIVVSGSSNLLLNGYDDIGIGSISYYLIPQTGHYVSEFSFDNINFYAVDSYFGTVLNFEFAAKVEYMVSTFNNQFTLELKGMPIGYTGTINIYLKTTATPYANLKEGGSSVSGIAVTSTKGGTAYIVGDDFESLADTDTVTIATKVSLSGYVFSHWEDMNGNNLGAEMSIRLQKAVIMDNVITAVYVESTNNNVNSETSN